jgi:hypothetical protein
VSARVVTEPHPEQLAGYQLHRHTATGTVVLVDGYKQGTSSPGGDDGRWAIICPHGSLVTDTNRRRLTPHAAVPWEWCEECRQAQAPVAPNVERFRQRVGHCYELAARYATDHYDQPGLMVVHGTIQRDPYPPNPHAWVTWPSDDGVLVCDPVLGGTPMLWPLYRAWANAVVVARYTARAAALNQLRTGHFGPWHRTGVRP